MRAWVLVALVALMGCGDAGGGVGAEEGEGEQEQERSLEPCPSRLLQLGPCLAQCVGFDRATRESCWIWGDREGEVCYLSSYEGGVLDVLDEEPFKQDRARCIEEGR